MDKKTMNIPVSNDNDKQVIQRLLRDFTEEDQANSVHLFLSIYQDEEYSLERAYKTMITNIELNFINFIEYNIEDREHMDIYLKFAKAKANDVHDAIKKSVEDIGLLGIYQLDFFYKEKGYVTLEGVGL